MGNIVISVKVRGIFLIFVKEFFTQNIMARSIKPNVCSLLSHLRPYVRARVLSFQLCPTLCDPMDCSQPGSSVHGIFPGKNTGVWCHFLLQEILTHGSSLHLLHLLQREADSLPLHYMGIPRQQSTVILFLILPSLNNKVLSSVFGKEEEWEKPNTRKTNKQKE